MEIEGDAPEESWEESPEEPEDAGDEEGVSEWELSDEEMAEAEASAAAAEAEAASPEAELKELNDKYVRLYAEYENYRKKAAKDREELAKYVREELIYDLLPSLDHLEIALQHAAEDENSVGLKQGVEMTLRELYRILEKYGLKPIEALGQSFDPEYHHAVSQVETDEVEDKTVVEVLRKGYIFGDKVIRAAMVSVARRPGEPGAQAETEEDKNTDTKEE